MGSNLKRIILIISSSLIFAACRVDNEEVAHIHSEHQHLASEAGTERVVHETDAVVGPDHAFFVYSFMNAIAKLEGDLQLEKDVSLEKITTLDLHSEAFSFDSNFRDERIELAADWILYTADTNQDGGLSLSELSKLKLKASDVGSYGSDLTLPLSSTDWQIVMGNASDLGKSDLKDLIVKLGLQVKDGSDRKSLIKEWLAYVARYDLDADGTTDYEEQQKLREDRRQQLDLIRQSRKAS